MASPLPSTITSQVIKDFLISMDFSNVGDEVTVDEIPNTFRSWFKSGKPVRYFSKFFRYEGEKILWVDYNMRECRVRFMEYNVPLNSRAIILDEQWKIVAKNAVETANKTF